MLRRPARLTERPWGLHDVVPLLSVVVLSAGLVGCADLVDPAEDPGRYELIEPEIVVVAADLERIALRGDVDDLRTPIGVHLGHGIVVDLHGHVDAIPQLLAETGEGFAVADPDAVSLGGIEQERLERTASGYALRGPVRLQSSLSEVEGGWEIRDAVDVRPFLTVDHDGERASIHDFGTLSLVVQSQGEHLLVQQTGLRDRSEIRYDPDGSYYEFDRKGSALVRQVAESMGNRTRISGLSLLARFERQLDAEGRVELVRTAGPLSPVRTRTTLTDSGWIDRGVVRDTVTIEGGLPPTLP